MELVGSLTPHNCGISDSAWDSPPREESLFFLVSILAEILNLFRLICLGMYWLLILVQFCPRFRFLSVVEMAVFQRPAAFEGIKKCEASQEI